MKILVTGGCGYIGAMLVPQLLADGHHVTVLDTQWFGHGHLPKDNDHLRIIKGDVRDTDALEYAAEGVDAIIWLASISNNAMYGVNYELTHAVNTCIKYLPVPRFFYASSVAVLDPTSDYAKDKLHCEAALKDTPAIIVRAASVCGYSPHQRFDLTLNMMTHDAYRKRVITVNGGDQERAHVHIMDLCNFYRTAVKSAVHGKTYTVWSISEKIIRTATMVAEVFKAHGRSVKIFLKERSDARSYSVDGDSARSLRWEPKKSTGDAVRDLIIKFDSGYWPDSETNERYLNIATGLS